MNSAQPSQVCSPIPQINKFNVYDACGKKLNPSPLTEAEVQRLVSQLQESKGLSIKQVLYS